jgi:cytochrome c
MRLGCFTSGVDGGMDQGIDMRAVMIGGAMALLLAGSASAQDAAAGKAAFAGRCAVCHKIDDAKSGPMAPSLKGVYGRRVASLGDFAYSPAMKAKGGKWTIAALEVYLASPVKDVPGGKMLMAVTDPADRANIIAYLKTAK